MHLIHLGESSAYRSLASKLMIKASSTPNPEEHSFERSAKEHPPFRRFLRGALLAAASLGALLLHVRRAEFFSDDGYIVLRTARNLLDGHGPGFNPGEPVEGVTSPLWLLLISLIGSLGVDLEMAARTLGLIFAGLALVYSNLLALQLWTRENAQHVGPIPWGLSLPGLLLACNGSFAVWAAGGLEAPLVAFLMVACVVHFARNQMLVASLFAAAMVWARPEGILLLLALIASKWTWPKPSEPATTRLRAEERTGWKQQVGSVITFAGPSLAALGSLFAIRWLVYRDVLPNTYYAKTGGGLSQLWRGVRYLGDYAAEHETLLILPALLIIYSLSRRAGRRAAASAVLGWCAAVAVVGGDGLPMFRFIVPVLPVLYALLALLLVEAPAALAARSRVSVTALRAVALFLAIALCYSAASPPERPPYYGLYRLHQAEVAKWSRVGAALKRQLDPQTTLALAPIGAVGYFSEMQIIDILGLTDRHIARVEPPGMGTGWAGHEKHDAGYVLSRCPDLLLLNNVDTTGRPRGPNAEPFLPRNSRSVMAREGDFYLGAALDQRYRPRTIPVGPQEFLNVFALRPNWANAEECSTASREERNPNKR